MTRTKTLPLVALLLLAALLMLLTPQQGANASRPVPFVKEPAVPKRALLRQGEGDEESSDGAKEDPDYLPLLWDELGKRDDLSKFRTLLHNLLEENPDVKRRLIGQPRRLTLLAPTNDAWDEFFVEMDLPEEEFLNYSWMSSLEDGDVDVEEVDSIRVEMESVMGYHIFRNILMLPDLRPGWTIEMANGVDITFQLHWDNSFVIRDEAGRTVPFWHGDADGDEPSIFESWGSLNYPPQVLVIDRVLFPVRPENLDEALSYNSDFSLFHSAVADANYTSLLESTDQNVTLLVPTNKAFRKGLDAMGVTYDELINDRELLSALVGSHVLPGIHTWQDIHDSLYHSYYRSCFTCSQFYPVEQYSWELTIMGVGSTRESNATIVEANMYAGDNSLMHKVSGMLLPLHTFGNLAQKDGPSQCRISCAEVRAAPLENGQEQAQAQFQEEDVGSQFQEEEDVGPK